MHECVDRVCKLPKPHDGNCDIRAPITISYTNYKGTTRDKVVSPLGIARMANPPWQPEEEWLLSAIDHTDGKHKFFPMRNIRQWREP